jgi:hypothetical protein
MYFVAAWILAGRKILDAQEFLLLPFGLGRKLHPSLSAAKF